MKTILCKKDNITNNFQLFGDFIPNFVDKALANRLDILSERHDCAHPAVIFYFETI